MSRQRNTPKIYDVDFKVVDKRLPLKVKKSILIALLTFILGIAFGFLLWHNPELHLQKQAYQISVERLQAQNRILREKFAASETSLRKVLQQQHQINLLFESEPEMIEDTATQQPITSGQQQFQKHLDHAHQVARRAKQVALEAQRKAENNLRQARDISRQAPQNVSQRASVQAIDIPIRHIFKVRNPGNRLEDLARHYQMSMTKLKQANPDLDLQITQQGHFLRVGSEVLIPE